MAVTKWCSCSFIRFAETAFGRSFCLLRRLTHPARDGEMLSSNRRVGGDVRKYLFSWCLLIAALCVGSSVAQADNVYDWKGTCTLGCTGTATGVLTLANGASPYNFSASQFLSFQFTSSSGSFFLDDTSPYLNAVGGSGTGSAGCNISNCSSLVLEQNAFGPNTLPLWQFLSGSYFYQCLDANCTTWTDDVVRNVGVDGIFTPAVSVPSPVVGAGLPGLVLVSSGLLSWCRRKRKAEAERK
jgi:hypothetical protein